MVCLNFLFLVLIVQAIKGDDIVQTENGPVQGKTVSSGKVEAFLGIPYAEPPVGPLRFAKPVPKESWEDVHDASQLPPPCIQPKIHGATFSPDVTNMNEDCLYLNIWTPRFNTEHLKTVMFFIHAGGFITGSSNLEIYNGAKLSEYGDVVVVSINYRVGGLGFFTGFNDDAPGSLGLYDQVMAMQWIKKNIKHFHGDPDHIVIFGESAGAISVSLHQISPLSKHLFKRAILQSGSALHPMYYDDNEKLSKICDTYAEFLGCTSDTQTLKSHPKEVINCLKNVPAEKFAEIDMKVLREDVILYPRIGNDFLPKHPIDAYKQGEFKDSEVLMGVTRDEGSLMLPIERPELFGTFGENDVSDIFNETIAFSTIKWLVQSEDEGTDETIRNYLRQVEKKTGYTYLKAATEAVGDILITCGLVFQGEYQSLRENPVYFYMFDHRPASTPLSKWMGVAHFEDVQYHFGNPVYQEFTEYETELSRDMMNMWVNFAKVGNPNILGGTKWPKYTYQDPQYYIIGRRDSVAVRPDNNRCEWWRKYFRSVIDDNIIQTLKKN